MNLRVKHSAVSALFFAYITELSTITIWYSLNHKIEGYLYEIVNAFLVSLTLVIVLEVIKTCYLKGAHSGAEFLLLVTAIYNYNSIIKFSVDSLYDGFISSGIERIFAGLYVDIIIVAVAFIWKKNMYSIKSSFTTDEFLNLQIPISITYILVFSYCIIELLSLDKHNLNIYAYSTTISASKGSIVQCIIYLIYAVAIISTNSKGNRFQVRRYIPLVALVIINLMISFLTGKKNYLMSFIFIIGCVVIYTKKINFSIIKAGIILSSPVLQLFTAITEKSSGRMIGYPLLTVARYHASRYDICDFAATISKKYSESEGRLAVILESIYTALPRALFPNIPKGEDAYFKNLGSSGLRITDYNDTLFSMGAQIGGYLGMFLCFLFIVYFYDWLSQKISKIKRIGPALLPVLINYFIMVENSWLKFVCTTRDMIILLLISVIFMRLFIHTRCKTRHKS